MKKIAVIMNTNEAGGAERSLVFQLQNQSDCDFTFFIPRISVSKKLEEFLSDSGFSKIQYYNYPRSIYSLSRATLKLRWSLLKDLMSLFFKKDSISRLNEFEMVYLNGNKAAFLFFAKNKFLNFKGKIVWHLRDYYYSNPLASRVWRAISNYNTNKLSFVCNSHSVKESLKNSPWKNHFAQVVYNPVGLTLPMRDTAKVIKTIGFVSMMSPWKGVHEIVLWSKLFEAELKQLGVESIKIFGSDIYKTDGDHNLYSNQIKQLHTKFKSEILSFEGHKEPSDIFNEIDCLIHYSLNPEPFGRVILEAFEAGVPVISTCLGGAEELVKSHVTGLKVMAYDRHGLYLAVEQLVMNKIKTFKIINGGFEKSKLIQKSISNDIKKILDVGVAS
jgi:glycosyltransferase involved in cell wall biosynthesis